MVCGWRTTACQPLACMRACVRACQGLIPSQIQMLQGCPFRCLSPRGQRPRHMYLVWWCPAAASPDNGRSPAGPRVLSYLPANNS
jgi:hypothetical protein